VAEQTRKSHAEQVLLKYQWAEKHIDKLNAALLDFRDRNKVSVRSQENPHTGEVAFYIDQIPAIPTEIPLITGDALHSLRGALDYLANGLVNAPTADTKFPIAFSPQAYESSLNRVVKGIGKEALEAINRIQPYQGGNRLLWPLHRMNNIDKHRLLLTVGLINVGHTLTPDEMAAYEALNPPAPLATLRPGLQGLIQVTQGSPVPLDAGKEFLTIPTSQFQQKMGFYFQIGINEAELPEGTIQLNLLMRLLSNEVKRVISTLLPFLVR
jgi:hypothetical protein